MNYSMTTYRQLTTDIIQTLTVVWRHAYVPDNSSINLLTLPWENALTALNPTGSTPGNWYGLQQSAHADGAETVSAASVNCDAVVSLISARKVTYTFTIKNTTQSGLAAAIQAMFLKLHGSTLPAADVGISNITIKVKGA